MQALAAKILFFILCITATSPSVAYPGEATELPPDPAMIAGRLQETYINADTISAQFIQETSLHLNQRKRRGSGTLFFRKPGLMRWDYQEPDRQVLISDGSTLSMYFERSNQLIRTAAREYLQSDVTYAFFSGTGDILRDFEVTSAATQENTSTASIRLVPRKPHPHVQYLLVWVDPENSLITRLQITDHFDTVTDLWFEKIELNPVLAAGIFEFEPPAGTEIIDQ